MSSCELFSGQSLQNGFEFPQQLTEKYRPTKIADFVGIPKAKNICLNLIRKPLASNWLFRGPSGVGKTSIALAMATEGNFEMHHIPSQECTLDRIQRVRTTCQYVPKEGCRAHMVLIDELDQATRAAQLAFLSILDATNQAPNTIWVGTCNGTDNLEPRFLSRFHPVEFSSYGISAEVVALLQRVWDAETGNPNRPNFQRICKEANNNVRAALMALETEIMSQETV